MTSKTEFIAYEASTCKPWSFEDAQFAVLHEEIRSPIDGFVRCIFQVAEQSPICERFAGLQIKVPDLLDISLLSCTPGQEPITISKGHEGIVAKEATVSVSRSTISGHRITNEATVKIQELLDAMYEELVEANVEVMRDLTERFEFNGEEAEIPRIKAYLEKMIYDDQAYGRHIQKLETEEETSLHAIIDRYRTAIGEARKNGKDTLTPVSGRRTYTIVADAYDPTKIAPWPMERMPEGDTAIAPFRDDLGPNFDPTNEEHIKRVDYTAPMPDMCATNFYRRVGFEDEPWFFVSTSLLECRNACMVYPHRFDVRFETSKDSGWPSTVAVEVDWPSRARAHHYLAEDGSTRSLLSIETPEDSIDDSTPCKIANDDKATFDTWSGKATATPLLAMLHCQTEALHEATTDAHSIVEEARRRVRGEKGEEKEEEDEKESNNILEVPRHSLLVTFSCRRNILSDADESRVADLLKIANR